MYKFFRPMYYGILLTFKCRPMKDIQINKIVQSLEMEDWHSLLATDANINTAYDNFIAKLWDIINTHAPEKTVTTRQSEMADLARRATRDLSQFHMGGPNFDTVRSWKL